jgi:hypothetical protein
VMIVVELDTPASAASTDKEDGSTSVPSLLQDADEASHSLLSFDDDITTRKHHPRSVHQDESTPTNLGGGGRGRAFSRVLLCFVVPRKVRQ